MCSYRTYFLLVSCVLTSSSDVLCADSDKKAATKILESENELTENGYNFHFKSSDGIARRETAKIGEDNVIFVEGSYEYTGTDGKIYTVSYVADKNGYHPKIKIKPNPAKVDEKSTGVSTESEKAEGRNLNLLKEQEKDKEKDLPDYEDVDFRIFTPVVQTLVGPG